MLHGDPPKSGLPSEYSPQHTSARYPLVRAWHASLRDANPEE